MRAGEILAQLRWYEGKLVETAEEIGAPFPMYPDDAALLEDTIMPGRVFPFRASTPREDIPIPVVLEEGWVGAEDFAILALLKVDQAIDSLNDYTGKDLQVFAGLLLEAYRCLLLAERARGREMLTPGEFDEFKRKYGEAKASRIKEQNRLAGMKKRKAIKDKILGRYLQLRQERPSEERKVLAREVADEYIQGLASLGPNDPQLSMTNAARTIKEWIRNEGDITPNEPELPTSPQKARQALKGKHRF
ncbi:hypothetical protein GMSM_42700 [Geomonas sp. Red276]